MTKRNFGPFTGTNARTSLVSWFGNPDKVRISAHDGAPKLIKPAAGVITGWHLVNCSFGWRYVVFYDQKTEPTETDKIDWVLTLPPETVSTAEFGMQIPFFSGIAISFRSGPVANPLSLLTVSANIEGVLLYA